MATPVKAALLLGHIHMPSDAVRHSKKAELSIALESQTGFAVLFSTALEDFRNDACTHHHDTRDLCIIPCKWVGLASTVNASLRQAARDRERALSLAGRR